VSHSIADVFREAGKRHVAAGAKQLAAFIENLPTDEDHRRFADAARVFLSFDMKIRNLPADRRRTELRAEGYDLAVALFEAAQRLSKEKPPSEKQGSDSDFQLFGMRLLMAELIVRGLQSASDKRVLLEAALQLHDLGTHAQATRSKGEAESARSEALAESSARRGQWAARLKTEAEKLRQERPSLSQKARAEILNKRFQKQKLHYWPTPRAMIEFARRSSIKL
jgi:hypothetical protein